MGLKYAEYHGSNLSDKWTHVYAPRSLVEARAIRRIPPIERRDMQPIVDWLEERCPVRNKWSREWDVLGPFVVILPDDLALEFKLRWC